MNTFHQAFVALAIGAATVAAQAQTTIVVEGSRTVDPAALIGEDSGSFYLSRLTPSSSLTRADVIAASQAAWRSGEAAALIAEDSGSAYFASLPLGPGLDRDVVVAELDHARSTGELGAYVGEDSGSAWLAQHRPAGAVAAAGGVTTVASATR
ncbi:MAG: hypothetical protein HXY24_05860 [Rubrivivax sp.]|nr:hypothetical protein [Rubrivivax sp.]